MQFQTSSKAGVRKRAIAVALAGILVLPVTAQTSLPAADEPESLAAAAASAAPVTPAVYSVVNVGIEDSAVALLNARGQAAFAAFSYTGYRAGFFDGDRLHSIGSLGGSHTWIYGLNRHGVVVGESEDAEEHSNILGFAWTARGGIRALAGASVSSARAINDRHQIVGLTASPGISARAIRWNPDGTVTQLGPAPLSLSGAYGINECGLSTGFADVLSGAIHATIWDRAGTVTDLGTPGGDTGFGMFINDCSAVAGFGENAARDRVLGFYWSRDSGMVPIDVEGGGTRLVADLNNRGEVVGDTVIDGRTAAYYWTLRRGLIPLPTGPATDSDVFDINNGGTMVGQIWRRPVDGGGARAMRWQGPVMPVDLNTRLHRPPAGMVLRAGAAINDDGAILAYSNAGLVLLRPGKRGTDAPVLGPVAGLPDSPEVGQDLALTLGFVDNDPAQTHRARVVWTDGCPSPAPAVSETRGVGEVRFQHRFCSAGLHAVTVRVTDSGGRATELQKDILIEAPALASVSGKGTLPAGARLPLRFALWAPLGEATPEKTAAGNAALLLSGPFQFRSEQMRSTRAGQQVRLDGTGRYNGQPGYRFSLDASATRMRLRVTHADAATGSEVVDYDNGAAAKSAAGLDRTVITDGGLSLRH